MPIECFDSARINGKEKFGILKVIQQARQSKFPKNQKSLILVGHIYAGGKTRFD